MAFKMKDRCDISVIVVAWRMFSCSQEQATKHRCQEGNPDTIAYMRVYSMSDPGIA